MHWNANAAPAMDDASTNPLSTGEIRIRSLPATLAEREGDAQGRVSTPDGAVGTSAQGSVLLSPGTCVAGKYVICDVLGMGGSAVVYAAEQVGLKRVVAFKHYPACGALASSLLERFTREAQLLARVHHENVVAVFDAGRMPDGSPYLVVQRLHGDSLATRLLAGPLPVMEAVDLACQALNALSTLSDAGITHRDVKPANLVLDRLPEGREVLKLVDFGIAKEAHEEASRALDEMVGTPGYMAPEQVRGENIDTRCDLYALGATLYEMLTGRTPHTGDTVSDIAWATLSDTIMPLRALRADCPEDLAQIVMRALARAPSDRFASAHEMKKALDLWRASQDSRVNPDAGHQREDLEDTLRIRAPNAPARSRGGIKKRAIAAVTCLAALGGFALSQALDLHTPSTAVTWEVAAQVLPGTDFSPPEVAVQASAVVGALVVRARAVVRALLVRASTCAAELVAQARTFTHELREAARCSAPAWGGESGGSARER